MASPCGVGAGAASNTCQGSAKTGCLHPATGQIRAMQCLSACRGGLAAVVDVGRCDWCAWVMTGGAALAGRVRELREVCGILAGEAETAGMLLSGEAGVGKSRLVAGASAAVA